MARSSSPLRYPGGKSQFYERVKKLIIRNNLVGCRYIEPYVGGAGVAIKLLEEKIVSKVIINDYDIAIYSFWHSVLNNCDEFCDLIMNTEITIPEWRRQKEIYDNKDNNVLSLGFATFFLNRTNFSGVIKARPIGGYGQQGNYKIDCRFNKIKLIKQIRNIAALRNKIKLHNKDAAKFIRERKNLKGNNFWFLDPPYYQKGKELYTNFYVHEDHINLANYVKKYLNSQKFIVTYDICDEIFEMYQGVLYDKITLNYSVEKKRKAKEFLFYNLTHL